MLICLCFVQSPCNSYGRLVKVVSNNYSFRLWKSNEVLNRDGYGRFYRPPLSCPLEDVSSYVNKETQTSFCYSESSMSVLTPQLTSSQVLSELVNRTRKRHGGKGKISYS